MTQCRETLRSGRRCELPGDHIGPHRSGDTAWHVPLWLRRAHERPNGLSKILTGEPL